MSHWYSNSTHPFSVCATGHPLSKTERARSAASRLPVGTLMSKRHLIFVIFSTPSGASITPSTCALSLSGNVGILRAASAPDNVPVSQPPAEATIWSSVEGCSTSGSTL
jgi:hypothetical protein